MNESQVMEFKEVKGGEKMKKLLHKKMFKNNKGFSLVELLIVIAIMGVMAVIAFNMFGGVLVNSKKRADEQQAKNIEKAIMTYCVDSNDWDLDEMYQKGSKVDVTNKTAKELIGILMQPVFDSTGREFGPYFSLKDPSVSAASAVNLNAYDPQWSTANGGDYTGWKIVVYENSQAVKVEPSKDASAPKVTLGTTPAVSSTSTTTTP